MGTDTHPECNAIQKRLWGGVVDVVRGVLGVYSQLLPGIPSVCEYIPCKKSMVITPIVNTRRFSFHTSLSNSRKHHLLCIVNNI